MKDLYEEQAAPPRVAQVRIYAVGLDGRQMQIIASPARGYEDWTRCKVESEGEDQQATQIRVEVGGLYQRIVVSTEAAPVATLADPDAN